jgi:magnesium chelatase accessory protein
VSDKAVPPAVSRQTISKLPDAQLTELENLGHLAHEEAPELIASHILKT